ncbi:MAG: hypothetical protein HYR88_14270 [Verrucomicrobia bacterium]|nr:hypothetical protein [Verrucomicrobiota bacterium]MBI3870211.1 hypothetical protein [Verrucomicrobiota bacterium]
MKRWISSLVAALVAFALCWQVFTPHRFKVSGRISKSACPMFLRQIEGAKATWALEHRIQTNGAPTEADLYGPDKYIRVAPTCSDGGRITIGDMEHKATCSVPMHSLEAGDVYVTTPTGEPIPHAVVSFRDETGIFALSMTDAKGFAHFEAWTAGPTFVRAALPGRGSASFYITNGWPARLVVKPL